MARIAETSPQWEWRVFFRDQNHDLMNEFLKDGIYMSIPVLAFFDRDFNEIGRWIERPAAQTAFAEKLREELAQAGLPEEQRRAEYRGRAGEAFRQTFWQETVREIKALFTSLP